MDSPIWVGNTVMSRGELVGWAMAGAGWLVIIAVAFACFRACRDDGDRTPQGKMARGCAFIVGMFFAMVALMPLADLAQHFLTR